MWLGVPHGAVKKDASFSSQWQRTDGPGDVVTQASGRARLNCSRKVFAVVHVGIAHNDHVCHRDVRVNECVTVVPRAGNSFHTCPHLRSIRLPSTIASLGEHSFKESLVESATFQAPSQLCRLSTKRSTAPPN